MRSGEKKKDLVKNRIQEVYDKKTQDAAYQIL